MWCVFIKQEAADGVGISGWRSDVCSSGLFLQQNEQRAAFFSTGCKAGSLYDDGAFGTPNGLGLAYVAGLNVTNALYPIGRDPSVPAGTLGGNTFLLNLVDPYGGMTQSRDLREIASFRDPMYRANSDILALNPDMDLSENRKSGV